MDFYLFYILRPWFLLLLFPSWGIVWYLLKYQDNHAIWEKIIAKRFLPYLLVSPSDQTQENSITKIKPAWFIGVLLTLMVISVSGPAWQRQAQVFSDDQTELAFVLKVTHSMQVKDLRPDRLTRGVFKISDLLNNRSKTRAALIAYSGSAHLVMPLTADRQILTTFAQSLEPALMPAKGDVLPLALPDALRLALQQLSHAGSVIVLTDSLNREQVKPIKQDPVLKKALKNDRIILYAIASPQLLNEKSMRQAASEMNAPLVILSPDDNDIMTLSETIENNFQRAQNEQAGYQDSGYYLVPLIALLVLFWFRRGFLAEAWRVQ